MCEVTAQRQPYFILLFQYQMQVHQYFMADVLPLIPYPASALIESIRFLQVEYCYFALFHFIVNILLAFLQHSEHFCLLTEINMLSSRKSLIPEFEKYEIDKVGNFSHLEQFPYYIMTIFLGLLEEINTVVIFSTNWLCRLLWEVTSTKAKQEKTLTRMSYCISRRLVHHRAVDN